MRKLKKSLSLSILIIFTLTTCNNKINDNLIITDNYEESVFLADKYNKNILIIFDTWNTSNHYVSDLLSQQKMKKTFLKYIIAHLKVDDKQLGLENRKLQRKKFFSGNQPLFYILDTNEEILNGPLGMSSTEDVINFLEEDKQGVPPQK